MKLYQILFYIIVFCNVSYTQIQQLREFKAEGHTFKELYQKADQLIPKHKLDNPEFRKAFREGKLDGVFLGITGGRDVASPRPARRRAYFQTGEYQAG